MRNLMRQPTYRSPAWLQAVREIEYCVLCNAHGTQAAHRNEGKGMGTKAPDCATAAICENCHWEIDNGKHMTLAERRARMDRAIVLTLIELVNWGKVGVIR